MQRQVSSYCSSERVRSLRLYLIDIHPAALTPAVHVSAGFDAAHVVDVSWRLDYALESGAGGSIHAPLYLVELTLQRPEDGARDSLRFSCSVEQLRDLVYRVQDAANQFERLAGAADGATSRGEGSRLPAASPA